MYVQIWRVTFKTAFFLVYVVYCMGLAIEDQERGHLFGDKGLTDGSSSIQP